MPYLHFNAAELQSRTALPVSHLLIGKYSNVCIRDRKVEEQFTEQHCLPLIAFKYTHFSQAFQSLQNAAVQTIVHFCMQICASIFVWMTTVVNDSHFSLPGLMQEFCSARQSASTSSCTLWVTVSVSAICYLCLFFCTVLFSWLECLPWLYTYVLPFLFLNVWPIFFMCEVFSPHTSVKLTVLGGDAPHCYACIFSGFAWFRVLCMIFLTAHERLLSVCVCALWFVFSKYAYVSLCVSVWMCVYNPRPFNSTTWIHPISLSSWLLGPLITEGPGRSNRCASWRCLSSTTVARNLCWTQCTGACPCQWEPAGAQKHCLHVPVLTGVCVWVAYGLCVCYTCRGSFSLKADIFSGEMGFMFVGFHSIKQPLWNQ